MNWALSFGTSLIAVGLYAILSDLSGSRPNKFVGAFFLVLGVVLQVVWA